MGMPGNPAPEPTSITRLLVVGRWWSAGGWLSAIGAGNRRRAANKDSPKWRVTISSGSRTAVGLKRAFQRKSILIYNDIVSNLALERGAGRPASAGPRPRPGLDWTPCPPPPTRNG